MASIRSLGSQFGSRLSYANVMSTLAFVVAFGGGTAYAAGLVVTSEDIVDGQVMTVDLADNAVTSTKIVNGGVIGSDVASGSLLGSDIADSSLTGADVAGNSLTGSDISESSLATVPNATKATNVNGVTIKPFEFQAGSNTSERTILSTGVGLTVTAACENDGDLDVYAITSRNARLITWSADAENETIDNGLGVESFTSAADPFLLSEDEGDQGGHTTYMTSGGDVVDLIWASDEGTSGAYGVQCTFVGTAFIH